MDCVSCPPIIMAAPKAEAHAERRLKLLRMHHLHYCDLILEQITINDTVNGKDQR